VRSEFEKESDSGTSVASDPARDDPCNVHLMATASEMILYLTIRFANNVLIHSNISDPARRTKNNVNAPSMIRVTPFKYERACLVKMRIIRKISFNRQTTQQLQYLDTYSI